MPYVIGDPRRGIDELIVRRAEVFREKQGINLFTGHPVDRIDRAAKVVGGTTLESEAFEASYDKLLIATGAGGDLPETEIV